MGLFRNRRDHLVHETLKSAVSKEWVYELSWFFACRLWCNNFWLDWYPTVWLLNAGGPLQMYFLFEPIMICFRQSLRHTLLAQLVSKLFVFFSRGRKYETPTISSILHKTINPLSNNFSKWSNTLKQLFECVWPFDDIGA